MKCDKLFDETSAEEMLNDRTPAKKYQLAPDINISVSKGVLQIGTKKPGKSYKDKLIVTLPVKELNRLEIDSVSKVASLPGNFWRRKLIF